MVGDPKETTDVEGRQFAVDAETVETEELLSTTLHDNEKLFFGTDDDFSLTYDGTFWNFIKEGVGVAFRIRDDNLNFEVEGGNLNLRTNAITEVDLITAADDALSLYTDGSGAGMVAIRDINGNQNLLEAKESDGGRVEVTVDLIVEESGNLVIGDGVDPAGGLIWRQRGAPTASELPQNGRMNYVSDGTDAHSAGDLVSARNDGGAIVDQVIAPASNDT